ncbi:MAG: hypothetical protein EON54_14460 [Alcaligenaceae bacterium]|nr:MAG: hypothetical protein EON54_14460 [Alcaligenaceae bacterium]
MSSTMDFCGFNVRRAVCVQAGHLQPDVIAFAGDIEMDAWQALQRVACFLETGLAGQLEGLRVDRLGLLKHVLEQLSHEAKAQ